MFWIKNIKLLSKRIDSNFEMSKILQKHLNDIESKLKDQYALNNDFKMKIEAIAEVLQSDRKDINALIQLVKKSTKGRK